MEPNSKPGESRKHNDRDLADNNGQYHQDITRSTDYCAAETIVCENIELTGASDGSDDNLAEPESENQEEFSSTLDDGFEKLKLSDSEMKMEHGGLTVIGGSGVVAAGGNITKSKITINKQQISDKQGHVTNVMKSKRAFGGGQKITHVGDHRQNISSSSDFVVSGNSVNTGQKGFTQARQGETGIAAVGVTGAVMAGGEITDCDIKIDSHGRSKGMTNIIKETTTFQGDQVIEHHGDVYTNITDSKNFVAGKDVKASEVHFKGSGASGSTMQQQASDVKTILSGLSVEQLVKLLQEKKFHKNTIACITKRSIDGNALENIIEEGDSALDRVVHDAVDKSKLKSLIKK